MKTSVLRVNTFRSNRIFHILSNIALLFIVLCAECKADQKPVPRKDALGARQLQVTRVAANDFLSLRSAPSSEASILARIPHDTMGLNPTTEPIRRKDAVWIGVNYRGVKGYVNSYYVQMQEQGISNSNDTIADHAVIASRANSPIPVTPLDPIKENPESSTPKKPIEPWLIYSIVAVLIILCIALFASYFRGWCRDFKTSLTSFLLTFLLPSSAAYIAYSLEKCNYKSLGWIVLGSALLHVLLHLCCRCKNCGGLYTVNKVRSDFLRQEMSEITETRNNHSYQKIVPMNVHEVEYECKRCGNRYTQIERHRA